MVSAGISHKAGYKYVYPKFDLGRYTVLFEKWPFVLCIAKVMDGSEH